MEFSEDDLSRASEWVKYWADIFKSDPNAAEAAEAAFCPPEPSPEEQPAAADPQFLKRCHADVAAMSGGAVVWDAEFVTRSPRWGLVWRADFWDPNITNQPYPSRATCWQNDGGETGMTVSGLQHERLELKA